jgi:NADH-quinone oxidoreductase subunit J
MAEQIIFYVLAIVIVVFSILSVTSRRILRSATYLLFVLLATAGLYLLMGYQFLFGVQVSV